MIKFWLLNLMILLDHHEHPRKWPTISIIFMEPLSSIQDPNQSRWTSSWLSSEIKLFTISMTTKCKSTNYSKSNLIFYLFIAMITSTTKISWRWRFKRQISFSQSPKSTRTSKTLRWKVQKLNNKINNKSLNKYQA